MRLDSHTIAQALCRPGAQVLDVGAGDGTVAERFRALGCEVVGLDISSDAVARMSERGMEAFAVDLDRDDPSEVLGERRFDAVVCLDVLEHTKEPGTVLARLLEHLADDGDVIISLPNVTHADVRLSLLGGAFEYRGEGLLDETHLRFFDRPAMESLVEGAGLSIRELHRVVFPPGATEVAPPSELVDAHGAELGLDEEATTYQWVVRAGRAGDRDRGSLFGDLVSLGTEQQRALERAEAHRLVLETDRDAVAAHNLELEAQIEEMAAHITAIEEEHELLSRQAEALAHVSGQLSAEVEALQAHQAEVTRHHQELEAAYRSAQQRRAVRALDRMVHNKRVVQDRLRARLGR